MGESTTFHTLITNHSPVYPPGSPTSPPVDSHVHSSVNDPLTPSTSADAQSMREKDRIRDIGKSLMSATAIKVLDGAGGAGTPMPAPNHPSTTNGLREVSLSISKIARPTDINPRDHAIGLLDDIRQQYESARINRLRLMAYGRESGLSCHEIGIVLGITGGAVAKAISRAGDLE